MQRENLSILKAEWRKKYEQIRRAIPQKRREEAAHSLVHALKPIPTLSFCSFGTEIDLTQANHALALSGNLFLPKIEQDGLKVYQVPSLKALKRAPIYSLWEPDPTCCRSTSLEEVELILVPGLCFDEEGYRLGYGKGFYDRLLSGAKNITVGIGFKEQRSLEALPRDSWDVPVQKLWLN